MHIPEDILATDIVQIWLSISQDKRVIIHKEIGDATLTGQTFAFPLSQEETLKLDDEIPVVLQYRILLANGKAMKSQVFTTRAGDLVEDGVITAPEA